MKTIVIFTRTIDSFGYPFNDDYHYNAYFDLLLALKARGASAYFASDNATYRGAGVFSSAYTASEKVAVNNLNKVANLKAGLVFEKGGFTGEGVMVLNPEFVHAVSSDKSQTYRYFAKYQPLSIVAHNLNQLMQAFVTIPGDLIVVKEPVSNGGKAVQIGTRKDVLEAIPSSYPLIIQEFIDTSVGVPGLVDGIHDVRVKIGGGKIFGGMLRQPAPGEYRANLAQGGIAKHLSPAELPVAISDLALEIDCFFAKYNRYYAIDFANTPGGWKLIELNSKPGLSPASIGEPAQRVIAELAEYLIHICPED